MPQRFPDVVALVKDRGYERREQPFLLASGQQSHDYVDAKYAVDSGDRLRLVSEAVVAAVGRPFDAVGGLTMGADALAHGVAMVSGSRWFCVRKEPKARGREQWIEGTRLGAGQRVVLVEDVVSTGGSILFAHDRVVETGAQVIAVVTLVDRGDAAGQLFAERGIDYYALVTYQDLGIEPVGPASHLTER